MTPSFKYFISFIVLLTSISQEEALQINVEDLPKTKVIECLVDIIKNLHETIWRMSLVTSEDNTVLEEILRRIQVPVVVNVIEQPKKPGIDTRVPSDIVVLFGGVDVDEVLKEMLWHRDTRFLIVYQRVTAMKIDFQKFWEKKLVKVFGVTEETEGVSLYSFQPYQEGDCNNTTPIRLDTWMNGTFLGDGFLFVNENSPVKTGHGCPINLTAANAEPLIIIPKHLNCTTASAADGVEARFVIEFAKRLNFSLTVCFPKDGQSWGAIFPTQGVLGEIHQRISDFGCGAFAQIPRRYGIVDFSYPYSSEECLTFVVPTGAGRDRLYWLKNLLGNLRLIHWLLIMASFISAAMFLYFFGPYTMVSSFMLILNSFLGRSVIFPRATSLKLLIVIWIIFSFIISNIYLASMGREITLPLESSEIETFQQLLDSDLMLLGHPHILRMLNADDPVHKKIIARFDSESLSRDEDIDRLLRKRDIAIVRPGYLFLYTNLLNPKARGEIGRLKECIRRFFPAMVLQKNSPFLHTFNNIIIRVIESGIITYWRSHFFRDISVVHSSFSPVTMKRSLGIFLILVVGLAVAVIAFIGELGFNYFTRWNIMRKLRKARFRRGQLR